MHKLKMFLIAASTAFVVMSTYAGPSQAQSCNELRLACEHKDRLGEEGLGNCRRYRETCMHRESHYSMCRRLRYQCLHKEQLGLEGRGMCEQYRENCR